MAINKELLEMIVCPRCKGDLAYSAENNALDCTECELRYAVEDDIPVLIADKAEPLKK